MFDKILIANRGEIACRVIRTAKRMGIKTVAVFSDADRDAVHVEMADEAVHLGPPQAAESYLLIDKIVAACKETGAGAVHPGYGFLSENAAFPEALAAAGVVFIGPPPKAIAAMGDKIESKRFANEAKVNTVPGHLGVIDSPDAAVTIAGEIGFPVMIKASAGGGGKGMRIAHSADEVADGFARAKSEAKSSFGDDRVFIEKFIVNPRHIEIQVLADKHGNVIHLGERECSIQRRNQKVLEEAPSPLLDAATRAEMGGQAVALARAVGYETAGTVEFVADQNKNFYFLEMNTRLQVEHPVTEMVTGLDLVEEMIRVAAGEKLSLSQDEVTLTGWSIESRVYAEDPFRGFLPSTGRLVRYQPPREGTDEKGVTVRNDTGVEEGGEISIYYDPMIAKLITHAPDRAQAIAAMGQALDAFYIDGIQHNIPFLSAIMQHERWQSGALSTGFIAEVYPDGFVPLVPDGRARRVMASVAAVADHINNMRRRAISQQLDAGGVRFATTRMVRIGDDELRVTVGGEFPEYTVDFADSDDPVAQVYCDWVPGQRVFHGAVDGEAVAVLMRPILNGMLLDHRGVRAETHVFTEREAELAALMPEKQVADTSKFLLCPMPGLVVSIAVAEGQEVKAGEVLAVVEAMKMENVLRADKDATVSKIVASPGDTLAVDAVILEFA